MGRGNHREMYTRKRQAGLLGRCPQFMQADLMTPNWLCPTPAGVLLAAQLGQSVGLALGCYASLAALHLFAGYQAVSGLGR